MHFLKIPKVTLKNENPNMIHGQFFTWVNINIEGFCIVKLKSKTHPNWKSIKIRSSEKINESFVMPIGAIINVYIYSIRGINKSTFNVSNANWTINKPTISTFLNNNFKGIKKINFFNIKTKFIKTKPKFIKTKPKFSSTKFNLKQQLQIKKINVASERVNIILKRIKKG